MRHSRTAVVVALGLVTSVAGARATPFLFTVMPTAATSKVSAYGYYELGYGERTFEPVAGGR